MMNDNMDLNDIKILGKYAIEDVEVKELKEGKAYGFFNRVSGEQVFPQTWTEANDFSLKGYARVKDNEYWGLINCMGELVIPCRWQETLYDFHDELCGVKDNNNLWGFVNTNGEIVLPCRWKKVSGFSKGVCVVCDENDTWSFIDSKGISLYTPNNQWKDIHYWSEELLPVQNKEGLWGFVNTSNELCIPYKWSEVAVFTDGRCAVRTDNGRWGAIDTNGCLVIPGEWDEPFPFLEGSAIAIKNGCFFEIDKQGNVINDYGNIEEKIARIEKLNKDANKFRLPMIAGFAGLVVLTILSCFFSDTIGYTDYNPTSAYSLFDSQLWLGWIVAGLGGLHTYDLIIPLALTAAFLYKIFANKEDFADFELQNHSESSASVSNIYDNGLKKKIWGKIVAVFVGTILISGLLFYAPIRPFALPCFLALVVNDFVLRKKRGGYAIKERSLRHFLIVVLLLHLPLRIFYFPLFAVNYLTAGEAQPQVLNIIRTSDEYHRGGHYTYYLIADIDNGIPCQIKTSKSIYDNYNSGNSSRILADVRQGTIGFYIVTQYKTERPVEDRVANSTLSENSYIEYQQPGEATLLRTSITTEYQDIPELQRTVSMDMFGLDCDNVLKAYQKYVAQYKPVKPTVDFNYNLDISFSVVSTTAFPQLQAEMIYTENNSAMHFLCDKEYAVDPLHKKLLTVDNILIPSEAEKVRRKAKESYIFIKAHTPNQISFCWYDGNALEDYTITYDGSSTFTKEFQELMEKR